MATIEVILKEKIEKLGAEADVVQVKTGYGQNYLVPRGKALLATKSNMRQLEALKAVRAEREANELSEAEKIAGKIKKLKLKLELATGQGGKAFGSITTKDLAEAIKEKGKFTLDRHQILLDKPIKSTGRFEIPVKLHPDVPVDLRLTVEAKSDQEGEEAGGEEATS
jgi:large subunit ribosomal protein L9